MSYLPLNKEEFIPNERCATIFGSGVRKWSDIKKYLGEDVFFSSSSSQQIETDCENFADGSFAAIVVIVILWRECL